jgi:hypothetical protein
VLAGEGRAAREASYVAAAAAAGQQPLNTAAAAGANAGSSSSRAAAGAVEAEGMQLTQHVKPLVERAGPNTRSSFDAEYCINLVSRVTG